MQVVTLISGGEILINHKDLEELLNLPHNHGRKINNDTTYSIKEQ